MKKLLPIIFCFIFYVLSINQIFGQQHEFAVRGFHLDLRVQVMKVPALKEFALQLQKGGVNTLIMEWEGSYPFDNHPLISNALAYSKSEVTDFVSYCEKIGIDVIPLQQSFGHVEYILRHNRYKTLREDTKDYSQVNPIREKEAQELFKDLYTDLIGTHKSDYIHIGGDETYLLGHGKESQKKVAEVGKGRLYGDYIKMLCDLVVSLGKRPVLWADIAMKYPDALAGLPKETIFIDWNYGWDINMFGKHSNLIDAGFEVWGAPALRSHPDNYFITQWAKHFKNIHDFIPIARSFNYKGMVMTSWSTSGLYSSVWESPKDLVELYPIRRVYPLNGFNMLLAAYFSALHNQDALNVDEFVGTYARENYGFSTQEAQSFWAALRANPYEINQGVVSEGGPSIREMRDSAQWVCQELQRLNPKKNKREFDHYLLMADMRHHYLQYMHIEERLNALDFQKSELEAMLKTLKLIIDNPLDKRFEALQKDFMFDAEIREEHNLRNSKIRLLYNRLKRIKA